MKRCFKCLAEKPLEDFYRHPMMADGHLGKCKRCARRDSRENRSSRSDYYRAYDRARHSPERVLGIEESKKRHPLHDRARVHVHNAVKRGKLKKQPCEVCGSSKVDAHHDDYTKPLEVHWLCRRHHMERHRMEAA